MAGGHSAGPDFAKEETSYTLPRVEKGSSIILNVDSESDLNYSPVILPHRPAVSARQPLPR